jgi:hypothetical protein
MSKDGQYAAGATTRRSGYFHVRNINQLEIGLSCMDYPAKSLAKFIQNN